MTLPMLSDYLLMACSIVFTAADDGATAADTPAVESDEAAPAAGVSKPRRSAALRRFRRASLVVLAAAILSRRWYLQQAHAVRTVGSLTMG